MSVFFYNLKCVWFVTCNFYVENETPIVLQLVLVQKHFLISVLNGDAGRL